MTLLWKKDGFLTIAAYTSDRCFGRKTACRRTLVTLLWKKDSFLAIVAYTSDAAFGRKTAFWLCRRTLSDAALEEKQLSDYVCVH